MIKSHNLILVFLISLLSLYGCKKDVLDPTPSIQKQKVVIEQVSWEHLEATNNNVAQKVNQLRNNNINTALTKSGKGTFKINESKIQIIKGTNFTTYTFQVLRENPQLGVLENYLLKVSEDGQNEQFLLKYHYTTDSDGSFNFDAKPLEIEIIDDDFTIEKSGGCVPEFVQVLDGVTYTYNERCTGNGQHEVGNSNCQCTPSPTTCDPAGSTTVDYSYVWQYNGCPSGSSPTGDNTDDDDSFGGSGGNGNSNDETINIVPVYDIISTPSDWQPIANCLNSISLNGQVDNTTINPQLLGTIDLTPSGWSTINFFLTNQSCSEEAQEEVLFMLNALLEDFHETELDELLQLIEDEQDYKLAMSDEEISIYDNLTRNQQLNYLLSGYNALETAEDLYPSSDAIMCSLRNGRGDAYRHALWNSLCTFRLGEQLTTQLTTAHENRPAPTGYDNFFRETEMDLFNNAAGRESANNSGTTPPWVAIQTAITSGQLRMLSNLNNCLATDATELIQTE